MISKFVDILLSTSIQEGGNTAFIESSDARVSTESQKSRTRVRRPLGDS